MMLIGAGNVNAFFFFGGEGMERTQRHDDTLGDASVQPVTYLKRRANEAPNHAGELSCERWRI